MEPFFDFDAKPLYEKFLTYAAPDIEVLDVNGDDLLDIYVVQTDEVTEGTYCGGPWVKSDWWEGGIQPPPSFIPPVDEARDILLIGVDDGFNAVLMDHAEPGCGSYVEKFGDDRTLILAQGGFVRPGHNLLLQW